MRAADVSAAHRNANVWKWHLLLTENYSTRPQYEHDPCDKRKLRRFWFLSMCHARLRDCAIAVLWKSANACVVSLDHACVELTYVSRALYACVRMDVRGNARNYCSMSWNRASVELMHIPAQRAVDSECDNGPTGASLTG